MAKDFVIGLQGDNQPDWAFGKHEIYVWYFENEHGEQWVAKREGDILRFTGLDISWKEIVLTLEQAKAESNRLKEYLLIKTLSTSPHYKEVARNIAESYRAAAATVDTAIKLPLAEWIFSDAEVYWLVSVLEASIPIMQWAREKNK